MIEEIPSGRISAEKYAHLKHTVESAGVDAIILTGGGHEVLEQYLTCDYGNGWKCGKFVCYKHNPELRPEAGETTLKIPSPEGNVWSNEIPERIIKQFTDRLTLTVGE